MNHSQIAIKLSGDNSASELEKQQFNEKYGEENIVKVIVDDDQHSYLNPETKISLQIDNQQFDSVLTAYHTLYDPNENHLSPININLLQEIIQKRYDQDIKFQKMLQETTGHIIVHKSDNQELGSNVVNFDGLNIVGQIMQEVRDSN